MRTEVEVPSKLVSDFRGRIGSSPLTDETDARFPAALSVRGVDWDLGIVRFAGWSELSAVDDDTVGVCVAEEDLLSGGVLVFLSTGVGFERYSLR